MTVYATRVIPGRREAANPEPMHTELNIEFGVHGSRFLAALGPGRRLWVIQIFLNVRET